MATKYSKVFNTPALVLRSVDYRDTDKMLMLLTFEHGKVSAVARSARNSRRRFSGTLEPLCVIEVSLAVQSSDRYTVQSSHVIRNWPGLLTHFSKLEVSLSMLRWIERLLPEHHPEQNVFSAIVSAWDGLLLNGVDAQDALIWFQMRSLAELGWHPRFDQCMSCGKQPGDRQPADFNPWTGSIRCKACGGGSIRLEPQLRASLMAVISEVPQGIYPDVTPIKPRPWLPEQRQTVRQVIDAMLSAKLSIQA